MTSDIDEICSRFYLRVKDYDVVGLEEKLIEEMMYGWIRSVVSLPYVRRLFNTLTIDEDSGEIDYVMRFSVSDTDDKDFVEEVFALGMVVEWLSPKYHSTLNTDQYYSNSEQKWYSQANHMVELREMYHQAKLDLRKLIRDRGYINNSYVNKL